MDVQFQQPFTESAYAEVKSKEAQAAQRKSTKQPSRHNDTFTFVPDEHTIWQEPVLNTEFSSNAKQSTSQTTDVDPASNMLLGTAKRRRDH